MPSIESLFADASARQERSGRAMVTMSYAQSLDGSIAVRRGQQLSLSSSASLAFSHRLRAMHDAILIGIGTLIADSPRLTVRLAPGKDPLPVVLDSKLRFPLEKNPMMNGGPPPLVVTTTEASRDREASIRNKGARTLRLPPDARGLVDVSRLAETLPDLGVRTVMVEGGARIITSFLSERLVDYFVITLAPVMVGGLHAVDGPLLGEDGSATGREALPGMEILGTERLGPDLVIWGRARSEAK